MMQTINPTVLTDERIAKLTDPEVLDAMIAHGSGYAKAMALAFRSLDGDCISQRKMIRDVSYLFAQWI